MRHKALVVLSGGQDSTTCLYLAIAKYGVDNVHCITFDYGQKHSIEIEAAKKVARFAGIPEERHEILSLPIGILAGSSPLTNPSVELEVYENVEALPGGLEKTFVPGRNILFLTLAANRASVLGIQDIYIGVSQEDFGGYPDCRDDFIWAMEQALTRGLPQPVHLSTPLIYLNKRQTVELAMTYPGCMDALKYSHTCYAGVAGGCGNCHACLLRLKGFADAGVDDPARA